MYIKYRDLFIRILTNKKTISVFIFTVINYSIIVSSYFTLQLFFLKLLEVFSNYAFVTSSLSSKPVLNLFYS